MFAAKRHLDDNALLRRYMAERGLEVLEVGDEPLLRHLAHCPSCQTRYGALSASLEAGRELAIAEADAAFTPDRLARQRDRIMRRIEVQAGARILAFPAGASSQDSPLHSRIAMRWVAAAAVAGIMVGLSAGRLLNFGNLSSGTRVASHVAAPATAPGTRTVPILRPVGDGKAAVNDDEFLSEVDVAVSGSRAAELSAIYAITMQQRDLPKALKVKYQSGMAGQATILIGPREAADALRAYPPLRDVPLLVFSEAEARLALDAVIEHQARFVVLPEPVAESASGQGLIHRISVDPQLSQVRVLIIGPTGTVTPLPPPAVPAFTSIDADGIRRVPRIRTRPGISVDIEGWTAMLIDLSTLGAQVLSPTVLRPGQRVRLALPAEPSPLRVQAVVAWASFEQPKGRPGTQYRAGLEFRNHDTRPVELICAACAEAAGARDTKA